MTRGECCATPCQDFKYSTHWSWVAGGSCLCSLLSALSSLSAVSLYKIKLNTTISVPCYCSLMDHFGSHSLRFEIGRREGGRYNWPAFLTHIQYVRSDNGSILGNSSHNSWQTCDMSSQMSRHDTRAHSDNPLRTQIFYYVNNLSLPKS